MELPFSPDQFFQVFAEYNLAVWPAQVALFALGLALVIVAYARPAGAARWIALGLAFLWAWMGAIYHLWFFRRINPAALVFGIAFLLQSALLVWWGIARGKGSPGQATRLELWTGGLIIAYGTLIYPLLGWVLGHRFPANPTFGLPCPTTITTLGLLALLAPRVPWGLLIIPIGWAVVGTSAALSLGVREDFGLIVAAAATIGVRWARGRRSAPHHESDGQPPASMSAAGTPRPNSEHPSARSRA